MNAEAFIKVSLMQGLELSTFNLEGCKPSYVSCSPTKALANGEEQRAAQGAARTMPASIFEGCALLPEAVRMGILVMIEYYAGKGSAACIPQ